MAEDGLKSEHREALQLRSVRAAQVMFAFCSAKRLIGCRRVSWRRQTVPCASAQVMLVFQRSVQSVVAQYSGGGILCLAHLDESVELGPVVIRFDDPDARMHREQFDLTLSNQVSGPGLTAQVSPQRAAEDVSPKPTPTQPPTSSQPPPVFPFLAPSSAQEPMLRGPPGSQANAARSHPFDAGGPIRAGDSFIGVH